MTNEEFRIWLFGYVILTRDLPLNEKQILIIKNHANLVLVIDGTLEQDNQMLLESLKVGARLGHHFKI